MTEQRHLIWSNYDLDYEDWRDDLEEDHPELTEDERMALMYEINNRYLDDERVNLNIQLDQPILVIADLGLWNGRRTGYQEISSGNIRDTVLPMVDAFYRSNAVDHPVPREIVERSFLAAAGNEPLLRGTLIFEEGRLAGYLYVTLCYSAEVGGTCVFIEEVYLLPEFRGRGLGRQVLEWIFTQYPDSRRFRLEVTQMNQGAAHLYEKCGFQYLRYDQMVLDR